MRGITIIVPLLVTLSLAAVQVSGLELGAGASFNTIAMDYLNELIATYDARMEMSLPSLSSGLSVFGSLTIGLPLLDLGLGVERIAASASAVDPRGNLESITASAVGFLRMGSWTALRGGLQLRINTVLSWRDLVVNGLTDP